MARSITDPQPGPSAWPPSGVPAEVLSALAPTGPLRAAINVGNPILASRGGLSGPPSGVSIDLAGALAGGLGLSLELIVFDNPAASVEAVRQDRADVGFFAIDPARSAGLFFTAPYALIEGSYAVLESSELRQNEQVDTAGHRIAVGLGSAYDHFLSRQTSRAGIVRLKGQRAPFEALRAGEVEVVAGIRPVLEDEAVRAGGLRVLPGRFMLIRQAMGMPSTRGPAASAVLAGFVEAAKSGSLLAEVLARHSIEGVLVAPRAMDTSAIVY